MRHNITFPRRAAAFFLALLLAMPVAYADAGERKLQTSTQIMDGLIYRNTITASGNNRVESYALELTPNSAVRPIFAQGNVTVYGNGTITSAISNAQKAGWHVLGAVNTDFFAMANGVPIGIVVENGVFKSSNTGENLLTLTNNGYASILNRVTVDISLRNQGSGYTVKPHHFNKARAATGGIYLLNGYFSGVSTRTTGSGWFLRMKVLSDSHLAPELTVNSTLTLQVTERITDEQAIVIGQDEYILTAADESGWGEAYEQFQVGDTVTLTTSCSDPTLSGAQWACGAGDIMVQGGALTDSSGWTYANDGRQPRTAVGVKEDGTLVLYAVDGRQSGYSAGLTQRDLALELQAQGCVTAANLDGGGSTALSLWLPGQNGPAVQSRPSGGQLRGCATYLLLVSQPGTGIPQRLASKQDGLVALTGSSLLLPQVTAIDEGLNPVSADLTGLTYTPLGGLGTITGSSYTAGRTAGTDSVLITAGGLTGSFQIHVVNQLTDLTVTRAGSGSALTSLSLKPEESVQLAVTGSYWGREALRDFGPVTAAVQGDVGTIDSSGLFTASQRPASGSITLSAGGLTKTIAVTVSPPYVHQDVTPGHWAYEAVEYCYSNGIVSGISDTLFGRDLPMSRGDFMVMLHNARGKPTASGPSTFSDVDADAYYVPAIAWAQEAGLASGMGGNNFAPTANISREQAFSLLYRYLPIIGKNFPDAPLSYLDQFLDKASISDYAKVPTATLASYGLASGSGGNLNPKGSLTRAEMASLLYRVLELDPSSGKLNPPTPAEQRLLALDQSQVTLASGSSVTLRAILLPALDNAVINWFSSDPNAAPVSSGGMVTNLYPGAKSTTVTITAEWNGQTSRCSVTCQPAAHAGTVVGAEAGLNVRSGPGTTFARVGALRNGAQVVVLGQEPGWYQILFRNPDGQAAIGYVSADYLKLDR